MNLDWVRAHCMSLPHATENVAWEEHLVFKIGGKMFAVGSLNPAHDTLSLKADAEEFGELTALPGVIPAPYMARNQWVQLQSLEALPRAEVKRLISKSYELIKAKLPKKVQMSLAATRAAPAKRWARS
jgi:predicted DNA-binding protein (MmcQ/YjbR family)